MKKKMKLSVIKDVLSRDEMKSIMAGSGPYPCGSCIDPMMSTQWAYCFGSHEPCFCPYPGGMCRQ